VQEQERQVVQIDLWSISSPSAGVAPLNVNFVNREGAIVSVEKSDFRFEI
jgi:hypothetical protein